MKTTFLTIVLAVVIILISPSFSFAEDEPANLSEDNTDWPPKEKGIKTWSEPLTGMKFVWIEPGCFQMGQSPLETRILKREVNSENYNKYYADELPRHEVCLDGFWMGAHEVTQGEWQKIMEYNPAHFNESPDFPVDQVSWEDTQRFVEKLNKAGQDMIFRLPTEAEWEYGARGGTTGSMYNTGDTITPEQANFNGSIPFGLNLRQDYRKSSLSVHHFPPNAFGLHDMHGNVWEWCNDWYGQDYYESSPKRNPTGPENGNMRVLRGGSWFRYAGHIRSATRYKNRPSGQYADTGFRLVRHTTAPATSKGGSPDKPVWLDPEF